MSRAATASLGSAPGSGPMPLRATWLGRPPTETPDGMRRDPSALIELLVLADGRQVMLRPVLPQDGDAMRSFVETLSPQSSRRRFHGAVKWLPDDVLSAMTAIDHRRHLALVAAVPAVAPGPVGGGAVPRIVAEARFVRDATGGAEFALAVADDWQGRGLGRALLERLLRQARARGIAPLEGTVLADNGPMLALARRLGARVRDDPRDASIVHVRLTD